MDRIKLDFEHPFKCCPVCQGNNLDLKAFASSAGFMSLPDINHSLCRECGSYFVNPQPTEEALKRFYELGIEEEYESTGVKDSLNRYIDPSKREYFIKNRVEPVQKYIPQKAKVLDIGCGTGVFVRCMQDRGYIAIGIDSSPASLSAGRTELKLENELIIGNWNEVPQSDFDLITAWTVIEHLKNPQEFLEYVRGHIKDRGILLLEFPTVDSLLFKYLNKDFFWVMPVYHLFLFSRVGMRCLLQRNGFEILDEYNMPKNWNMLNSILKKLKLSRQRIISQCSEYSRIESEVDIIFDNIAYDLGCSSSVYYICQKRPD